MAQIFSVLSIMALLPKNTKLYLESKPTMSFGMMKPPLIKFTHEASLFDFNFGVLYLSKYFLKSSSAYKIDTDDFFIVLWSYLYPVVGRD